MRVVLCVVAFLVLAPVAEAQPLVPPGATLSHAQDVAAATFPSQCATVTVGFNAPAGLTGWASPPCRVDLAPNWESLWSADVCVTMVHEYGHLIGLEHSPDPDSVMSPTPSAGSVPACALLNRVEAAARFDARRFRHHRYNRRMRLQAARSRGRLLRLLLDPVKL